MLRRVIAAGIVCGAVWALPSAGWAQIKESSTLVNNLRYTIGGQTFTQTVGANASVHVLDDANPNDLSEVGIDLTGELTPDGSFHYLNNAFCVSQCSVQIDTLIDFTLENIGSTTETIQFNSLVTPGHAAILKSTGSTILNFLFSIEESTSSTFGSVAQLYGAQGQNLDVTNPEIIFNEKSFYDLLPTRGVDNPDIAGGDFNVLNWGATDISVRVQNIAPGETRYLRYRTELLVQNFSSIPCSDLTDCTGVQIAFGDPRKTGGGSSGSGGSSFARMFGALLSDELSNEPIIGRTFEPYVVPLDFVPPGTTPDVPPPTPPVTYGRTFASAAAVPEPASWATMIAGFALLGVMLRRRSSALVALRA
jgi:hypothetical protein